MKPIATTIVIVTSILVVASIMPGRAPAHSSNLISPLAIDQAAPTVVSPLLKSRVSPPEPANPLRVTHGAARARVMESYGKLPLSFEANRGQTDRRVKFLSRGSGYTLFLTSDAAVLTLRKAEGRKQNTADNLETPRGQTAEPARQARTQKPEPPAVLRMRLVGSQAGQIRGQQELPGRANYFLGHDPAKWRTGIATFAKVKYAGVYPGVDLVYYGNQGQLEYDFVVAPGPTPALFDSPSRAPRRSAWTEPRAIWS